MSRQAYNFATTPTAIFRKGFHEELSRFRKTALRMGYLNEGHGNWQRKPQPTKDLLIGRKTVNELVDDDFSYDVSQKQIDMKIDLDISSLAFEAQVNQIVLVSGDSDFVPAAKVARREGIDFILDPMWASIKDDLFEHIDGLRSTSPSPYRQEG